jgi:hypothetical protein
MRTSLKCLVLYLIVGVILLNLYFLVQLYLQHQTNQENEQQQQQQGQNEHHHRHHHPNPNGFFKENNKPDESLADKLSINTHNLKNSNEFLILDWTGHQHIFREQDPIKCKSIFSNENICCHLYTIKTIMMHQMLLFQSKQTITVKYF